MAFRESSDTRIRYGRLVGMLFLIAGFTVIGVAWNGAASVACVDCQFPYLISGGAAGLGLIVVGSALLVISSQRAERLHLETALREVMAGAAPADATQATTRVRTGAVPNGKVVVGNSTYHRPDCRLVQGKDDLPYASVDEAVASGLEACRVCNPVRADRAAAR
jgi:hypothetical protein